MSNGENIMSIQQKLRRPPRRKKPSQVNIKQKMVKSGVLIGNKFNKEVG